MSLTHLGGFILRMALTFFWVRPYTITADYIAKQYTRWNTQYALLRIQLPLKNIEGLESLVKIVDQASGHFGLYYYVVNICLNELISDLVLEALLDGSLISRPGVLEPERHGRVAVGAEGHNERGLNLVFLP
jgi:hypothetical protein